MSQNRNDMESSKDIKLTLIVRKDEKGRSYYTGEYDPEDLKDLCIVLLTDDRLKEVATLATAQIVAREPDPEALLTHIRDFAEAIRDGLAANRQSNP